MSNLAFLDRYEKLISEYNQCDIEYDANQMTLLLRQCWDELNRLDKAGFILTSEYERTERMAKSFINKYIKNDLQNCGLSPMAVDVTQFADVLDFISDYIYDKDTELLEADPHFSEPKYTTLGTSAKVTPAPQPTSTIPAASPEPAQSTEKHVSNKTGLIIMRVLFALVAIGGAFIFTYGAPVIGGIIFVVGAFLFWVALKMKPEDLNNDSK